MWRDVELRELRIFLVLADELHFGRTAERMGISQPGVSEAVRVLESRLGVRLFDRTSRRVGLTSAGEEFRGKLVPALAALERVLAETADASGDITGVLRVGFVLTTGDQRSAGSSRRSAPAIPAARSGARRSRRSTPTGRSATGTSTSCVTGWPWTNPASPPAPRSPTTIER